MLSDLFDEYCFQTPKQIQYFPISLFAFFLYTSEDITSAVSLPDFFRLRMLRTQLPNFPSDAKMLFVVAMYLSRCSVHVCLCIVLIVRTAPPTLLQMNNRLHKYLDFFLLNRELSQMKGRHLLHFPLNRILPNPVIVTHLKSETSLSS